jgi:hypothetical protein
VLRRFPDWQSRLNSYLEARRSAEFHYGGHDCCLFTADAILAMTGTDLAANFRHSYRSRFGAMRRIRSYTSGISVSGVVAALMQEHSVPGLPSPAHAQRGDAVLLRSGETLGLISLQGSLIATSEYGWIDFPLDRALRAWRI